MRADEIFGCGWLVRRVETRRKCLRYIGAQIAKADGGVHALTAGASLRFALSYPAMLFP